MVRCVSTTCHLHIDGRTASTAIRGPFFTSCYAGPDWGHGHCRPHAHAARPHRSFPPVGRQSLALSAMHSSLRRPSSSVVRAAANVEPPHHRLCTRHPTHSCRRSMQDTPGRFHACKRELLLLHSKQLLLYSVTLSMCLSLIENTMCTLTFLRDIKSRSTDSHLLEMGLCRSGSKMAS